MGLVFSILAIILGAISIILLSSSIVSSEAEKDAKKYFEDLLEKLKNNDDLD